MALIQNNTAYTRSFLMVYTTDHLTGATGVTITVNLSKSGGAYAPAAGSVSAVSAGLYTVSLTAVDTGTLGDLMYYCTGTNVDPTNFVDQVVTANFNALNVTAGTTVGTVGITGGTYAVNFTGSINNVIQATTTTITGGTVNPVQILGGTYSVNLSGSVNNVIVPTTTTITGGTVNPVQLLGGTYAVNLSGSVNNVILPTTTTITGGTISGVSGSVGSVLSPVNLANGVNVIQWVGGTIPAPTITGEPIVTFVGGTINSVLGSVGSVVGAVGSVTSPVSLAGGTYAVNISGSVNNVIQNVTTTLAGGTYAINIGGSVNNVINPVNITGGTISAVTGAVGSVTGAVGSVTGSVGGSVASVTGSVNSVTTPVSISGGTYAVNLGGSVNNVIQSQVVAVGGVNVTQWAGGTVPTPYVTGEPIVTVSSGTISTVSGSVNGSVVGSVSSVTNPVSISAGTYAINLGGSINNVVSNVNIASQQIYVKKNAALNGFMFLMLSSTDHVTPKTGLTITSQVSINGAGFNATVNNATEIGQGVYTINLAAADTNGQTLMFLFTSAGADNRYIEVITQN